MNMPIVSIIIPVYNVAEFLPRCIESVLSQTFNNFELILVDDGSSDKSGSICDEYASKDERIRVFHNENGGAGAARKFGVQQSLGTWIEFVDGDDTIPSDSLEKLYQIAEPGDYDIVVGTLNLNNNSKFVHKISGAVNKVEYIKALLLNETSIGPVAKLYKSSLFRSLQWNTPKEIKNNEDLLMLVSLATKVSNVYISSTLLAYNYLYREGSASKSKSMPLHVWVLLFSHIESLLHEFISVPSISQAFVVYRLRMLYLCNVLQGDFVDPNASILQELKRNDSIKNLKGTEKKIWQILHSSFRQRMAYTQYNVMTLIKRFVKRLLGRQ